MSGTLTPSNSQPNQQNRPFYDRPSSYLANLESAGSDIAAVALTGLTSPWTPRWYFFYGTLTDHRVLNQVLGLPTNNKPVYRPAGLYGYEIRKWGSYDALVDDAGNNIPVLGQAFFVQTEEDEKKLKDYETKAYNSCSCRIYFKDCEDFEEGKGWVVGRAFKYAGEENTLKRKK